MADVCYAAITFRAPITAVSSTGYQIVIVAPPIVLSKNTPTKIVAASALTTGAHAHSGFPENQQEKIDALDGTWLPALDVERAWHRQ